MSAMLHLPVKFDSTNQDWVQLRQAILCVGAVHCDLPLDRRVSTNAIYAISVQTTEGKELIIKVCNDTTVAEAKRMIFGEEGIPLDQQEFFFEGKRLQSRKRFADYGIARGATLKLELNIKCGGIPCISIPNEVLAPEFDFDFTNLADDGRVYVRGGEVYRRPYGWQRFALRVKGLYEDDLWLGEEGARSCSNVGEWPISYHGTSNYAAKSIAQVGYQISKVRRFDHGVGVYSTPDINLAEKHAQEFTYRNENILLLFRIELIHQHYKRFTPEMA